jgi:hypothetical protein
MRLYGRPPESQLLECKGTRLSAILRLHTGDYLSHGGLADILRSCGGKLMNMPWNGRAETVVELCLQGGGWSLGSIELLHPGLCGLSRGAPSADRRPMSGTF